MKRGSSHKPPASSHIKIKPSENSGYRIYGTTDVLNDPPRRRRASQAEAHKARLESELGRRLKLAEGPMVRIKQ